MLIEIEITMYIKNFRENKVHLFMQKFRNKEKKFVKLLGNILIFKRNMRNVRESLMKQIIKYFNC